LRETLISLREAIRAGRCSSVEAVTQALSRYERCRDLNVFISLDADAALAAARAADERWGGSLGSLPPLHGVPLAHKDMFDRQRHRCSFGSRIQQSMTPKATSDCVRRLERAGSITLGALNMSEFALGPTGHNATFGHCRNPWDPRRVAGGSSSGAAVAVAAGIVHGALGSDTGGSLRIPAACCGVVGLKPTHGRISARGSMPLAPSLDCIGPIAGSVADCAALFELLVSRASGRSSPTAVAGGRRLRIMYPAAAIREAASPEVSAALEAAAESFRAAGVVIEERPLPDIERMHDLADVVQKPESAAVHYENLRRFRDAYTPHVRRRIEAGFLVAAPAYVRALAERASHLRAFVENTLAGAAALLIPTVGCPVPSVEETDEEKCGSQPTLVARMTRWTRWLNYLGVPALSVPCGFDSAGCPIGLQLVGRPRCESTLFDLGLLFQERTPWHEQQPEAPRIVRRRASDE
jgi:aspartyl-tRNA(Asn)/glutamyl-tRNA(Gln) amidotransferase subunit A